MLFIKGFYQYQSGHIEDGSWLNIGLIKSFKETDFYDTKKEKSVLNVLRCDMGVESSDKVPYVDLNKPIEFKELSEILRQPEQKPIAKRGRPPKIR